MGSRGHALCAIHNKWRDANHLYHTGFGSYRCFSHRLCQTGPRPLLHSGQDKGKLKGFSKGKYVGYLIPLPSPPTSLTKGGADKGKGEYSKGKDKGSHKGKPMDGKGKDSLGPAPVASYKGMHPKGKDDPIPSAAPLQQDWCPECWTCGSPGHVRANCTATCASVGLPPPPSGSCLECGVAGHARWQCPIHLRRPDGTGVILRCALHSQLRSAYNLIWSPTLGGWRCALYTPCQ